MCIELVKSSLQNLLGFILLGLDSPTMVKSMTDKKW